jgi:1,4-dihydroxy-2-naphthoate octaprenyltransferase
MIMFITKFDKKKLLKFIKLGKPHLAGSLFFYFSIGALLAVLFNAPFDLSKFILGWIIIFLSGWAVHYHNDYFDFETDHNTKPTAISGGSGILIEHPEWRRASIIMAITLIALSIILSIAFTFIYAYPITFILFIIIGNIIAWFYAAPPIKLSYRGLGEFGNTTIGLIFPGVGYFALMGTLNLPFFIFVIPMLFLQMLFANSVEIPDMEGDKIGGKITWIVSRGRKFGFKLIAISGLMVTISFLSLSFTGIFPSNIDFRILATISLIPLSLGIIELIKKPIDKISATKFCTYNLASVIITAILINFYFMYLIII